MTKYWKIGTTFVFSLIATWLLLFFMKKPLFGLKIFDKEIMNFYLNYELSTILVSLSFLVLIYIISDRIRLDYINISRIDGKVLPAKWIGLNPKEGEGWKTVGLTIGTIITVVTAIVVYFQVAAQGISVRLFPEIPLIIILALMNSFTEEVIYRLSYTTVCANEKLPHIVSEVMAALVFGTVHYFGIAPNGLPGALMAGFIGWFLAKSINKTKGFFWAWAIHFAQDVVIMFFLFMRR